MGLTKWAFQRHETRVPVLPIEITGILTFHEGGEDHKSPFFVWDVSPKGLGILCGDRLLEGEFLKLCFAKPLVLTATCKVVWCDLIPSEADVHQPTFRCGLLAASRDQSFQNFVELVEAERTRPKKR